MSLDPGTLVCAGFIGHDWREAPGRLFVCARCGTETPVFYGLWRICKAAAGIADLAAKDASVLRDAIKCATNRR